MGKKNLSLSRTKWNTSSLKMVVDYGVVLCACVYENTGMLVD